MLKFTGKNKCLPEFIEELIKYYGGKTTIKEVITTLKAMRAK